MSNKVVWAAVLALGIAVNVQAQEKKAEHKYIGVKKCSMCHKAEAKGNQFGQWQATAHSKAYATLASEKALAIGKEKGLDKPPQQSDACLKCHVTGHGKPAEMFDAAFVKEDGVGCESCHGPGSDYQNMKIMKDREASVAAGLIIPTEATCRGCHNEENPTHTGFDFKKSFAAIAHPNPQKAAADK